LVDLLPYGKGAKKCVQIVISVAMLPVGPLERIWALKFGGELEVEEGRSDVSTYAHE
jgi:hypothetical protein